MADFAISLRTGQPHEQAVGGTVMYAGLIHEWIRADCVITIMREGKILLTLLPTFPIEAPGAIEGVLSAHSNAYIRGHRDATAQWETYTKGPQELLGETA